MTVGGIYGGIHAKTTTFSRLFRATVSAPAEEEIDNEYPYLSAQERDAVRQKKQTAQNTADIATNTSDIETNAGDIATNARAISSISADIANFGEVYATKASVASLSAKVANIESLFSGNVYSGNSVATLSLKVGGSFFSGKTINYLGKDGSYHLLYVLGHE